MCTLVVLNELIEGFPLVIAGNRDERYDRTSLPPEIVKASDVMIIRPWDAEKDGTWLGIAQDGWFVGLTNQDDGKHNSKTLSRGKIVDDCLHMGNHAKAARLLLGLDKELYNPFNVIFGRPGAMFLCRVCPGLKLELEPLAPGVHVISNDCCGVKYQHKVEHAHACACRIDPKGGIDAVHDELFRMLGDHRHARDDDPFQALCVHAEEYAFGTRSTSIITVSNQKDVEYWYSEGHPCQSHGLTLAGRMVHRSSEVTDENRHTPV
jgi:uncharacterized protein with NRDE domain